MNIQVGKIYYIQDFMVSGYYKVIDAPTIIKYGSRIMCQNIINGKIEEFINIKNFQLKYRELNPEEKLKLL